MDEIERLFADLPHLPPERRWRQQFAPVLGVITLIRRSSPDGAGERMLLIQRRRAPYAGMWALVGGKVEFGETLAQATWREVEEETGLKTTFLGLRGIVNERLVAVRAGARSGHFVLFVCAVNAPHGQPQEKDEGRVAWFTRQEIDALHAREAIIPSDYAMIRRFGAGQDSLPYSEVEMVTTLEGTALRRFEEIG